MFLIPVLFILMRTSMAGELSVAGIRNYKLSYNNKEISISSPVINLNFKRVECNSPIFKSFLSKMEVVETAQFQKGSLAKTLNFTLNGKQLHERLSSPKAKFIDSLPEELQRMKIEEGLRCKNEKSSKKSQNSL